MTDRYFAECCYGTDQQHASWQPCPNTGASDGPDCPDCVNPMCTILHRCERRRAMRASPEGTRRAAARSAKPIARGAAKRQAPNPSVPSPDNPPSTIQGEKQ